VLHYSGFLAWCEIIFGYIGQPPTSIAYRGKKWIST
jgi:hypothetical protein